MFENIINKLRQVMNRENENTKVKDKAMSSKDAAKERLHLVLMQDRANVSADFLDLMRQEIIDVIKKYIEVDESEIDVRLTNRDNDDGTKGAPALYANIPIVNIREDRKKFEENNKDKAEFKEEIKKDETENKKVQENIINDVPKVSAEEIVVVGETIEEDSEGMEESQKETTDEAVLEEVQEEIKK
ncbi:cell division topological specificity factor MinE [compost metagenome]